MNMGEQVNLEERETLPLRRVWGQRKKQKSNKTVILRSRSGSLAMDRDASLPLRACPESSEGMTHRRRYVLIGTLIFFLVSLLLPVVGSLLFAPRYQRDLALAQTGMQHLRDAETFLTALLQKPFDAQTVSQAQQAFSSASSTFAQLNDDLKSLPVIATLIPVYGTRLSVALHLVPFAVALSQAGVMGCDILNLVIARLQEGAINRATTRQGITLSDLATIAHDVQQMRTAFTTAVDEANQLQLGDVQFDPRIGKLLDSFHKDVPMISGWFDDIERLLPAMGALLGIGTSTNYLIELLDSTELRPGGGFIGNYGIATLSDGRLTAAQISDVDLLDKPFEAAGHTIPYPAAYAWFDIAPDSWSLRDSNLDADFPTAARYAELTYMQEGGHVPVQGVIAMTPTLIQQALAITGPIAVPEYSETVTAQNLVARIHYHQLGGAAAGAGSDLIPAPDGHSSQRKRFTELLGEHFLARVRQLSSGDAAKFFQLMIEGVRTKDLQIYFNESSAEALLHGARLDSSIQTSPGDGLFVVDANIGITKANSFITNTLSDTVTIDAEGNAVHHLTLRYAWTTPGQMYGSPLYRDYVRVYVPVGSVLQGQDGWQLRGTSQDFHSQVWAGFFTLVYGQVRTITLTWSVPRAATKDAHGWQYQELIQRQAGAVWTVHVQIILPTCAALTSQPGGMVSTDIQSATFNQALNEDLNIGLEYVQHDDIKGTTHDC